MSEFWIVLLTTAALNQAAYLRRKESGDIRASLLLGVVLIALSTSACVVMGTLNACLLAPAGLEAMSIPAALAVIAALLYLADRIVKNAAPELEPSLRPCTLLTGLNCAVVYAACAAAEGGFAGSVRTGFWAALGVVAVNALLDGIRVRVNPEDLPAPVRGTPILLLCAALISMALMGLAGLSF